MLKYALAPSIHSTQHPAPLRLKVGMESSIIDVMAFVIVLPLVCHTRKIEQPLSLSHSFMCVSVGVSACMSVCVCVCVCCVYIASKNLRMSREEKSGGGERGDNHVYIFVLCELDRITSISKVSIYHRRGWQTI